MSHILPLNIFPPTAKPHDSKTISDSPLITITRPKTISATETPRPTETPSLYSKPFTTLTPQETETPRETPLTYPQTKAIKLLEAIDINTVNDYAKQP